MPKITFDSDEEFSFEEKDIKSVDTHVDFQEDSDSDDDAAPEAVSISLSRSKAQNEAKAQKEAALKQAKIEKEKRRQRDLLLKEQKQTSKRGKKLEQQKLMEEQLKQHSDEEEQDHSSSDSDEQDSKRLPQEVLDALNDEEDNETTGNKRTHLTMADFEQMEAEEQERLERKLKAQRAKQKKAAQGRMVGEYTVKVLNNRPKVAKANAQLQSVRNQKLQRKSVQRTNAVIEGSANLSGGALIFRRAEPTPKKNKK
ncbi:uncharacterized protein BX664DRAFT_356411 [Halteromyces radiatus]|uniref:uncharacterized protein n=1 Tax=Halteromyces radiatus TaxID=101107 RepID=UPI00221F4C57|nr:uncharacterized protein BX664DRAFT_356411 [Halteromyces radiatus]KAI8097147.1 hypothetical protein BX664DRAFT_356411 [Halteromyces radiatus]